MTDENVKTTQPVVNFIEESNVIKFYTDDDIEVMRFEKGGKCVIRGEQVDDNVAVYNALQGWMENVGLLPPGKPPLSIDVYDPRNVIMHVGGKPLAFVQGIRVEAAVDRIPSLIEVTVPDSAGLDLTEAQSEALVRTIDTIQEHGGRVFFRSDYTMETNADEQNQAEDTLRQMGLVKGSVTESMQHTVGTLDSAALKLTGKPTLSDTLKADK